MPHKTLPRDIETICVRLEQGYPAWKVALEYGVATSMIYHWYRWRRGYSFTQRLEQVLKGEGNNATD